MLRYTNPARITRRISVTTAGVYTVTDATEAYFSSELITPENSGTRTNGPSPREQPRYLLRWHSAGILSPHLPIFDPGERVQIAGITYELVSTPKQIGASPTEGYYEAEMAPVEELYPLVGDLEGFGGTNVTAGIRFSAYANDEAHDDQGTYENFKGEAPIDHRATIKMNLQILSGASIYKIVSAEIDTEANFVRMELRRSGG